MKNQISKNIKFERTVIFLFITIVMVVFSSFSGAQSKVDNISVNADNLKIDSEKRVAKFEGNVRAVLGNFKIICSLMEIGYTENGELKELTATGKVTFTKDGAVATANKAVYNSLKQTVVLSGNPVLKRGENSLKGSSIKINIKSGIIDIFDASAVFTLTGGVGIIK
ncbi:MAG: hypothetical protein JXR91_13225 [Deltaproteobacteria bacterium]|nr:hypothetical protein [Deltaproteobacteria bacterium]